MSAPQYGKRRLLAIWTLMPACSWNLGCAAPGTHAQPAAIPPGEALPSNVDAAKAMTPFARIEPKITQPVRPADLKPLSERSVQQIVAARGLIDQQRFTEAALELERALRYDANHPDIHRTLALLQWQAGNAERAKSHAERAIQGNPDDASAQYVMGRCLSAAGETLASVTAFRTAVVCSDFERDGSIAALIQWHLAEALAKEGYLEAALSQYAAFEMQAEKVGPAPQDSELANLMRVHRGSARDAKSLVLERLGRFSEAADVLAPAAQAAPADPQRLLRWARLLDRAGRSKEALDVLRTLPGGSDEGFALLLEIHERSGQPDEAVRDLRARLADRPDDARLAVRIAVTLVNLKRPTEARALLQEFLQRRPEAEEVRTALLDMLVADSAWNEVLAVSAAAFERPDARSEEYERRIAGLASKADAVAALVEQAPAGESPAQKHLRGVLAAAAGRLDRAEVLFSEALSQNSEFVPARVAKAQLCIRTYRYDEALAVARRRDETLPESAGLEYVLGQVYERLDDMDNAALHFKAAFQLDPSHTQAMLELAKLQRRGDDILSAQRQFRALLERQPTNEEARESLALMYLNEGKVDAAAEQLEELKRRGQSPNAKARAQALLDFLKGRDTDAYRKALREAMDSNGPDVATWFALADSYTEFEQVAAREAYLNVLALDSDHEGAALGVIFAEQRLLEYEKAAARMVKLVPRRPNRHAWRLGFGGSTWQQGLIELYLILQDFDAAIELARKESMRPGLADNTRTRYRLAILESLRAAGRNEDLLQQLKTWSEGEGEEALGWKMSLAAEYRRQDQLPAAMAIYEAAFRANPTDREALADWIDVLAASKQYDRAAQHVLDWMMEDPENDASAAALVAVLAQQERFAEALDLVRNRLLITRDRERFQDAHVVLLDAAKQHTEAVDYLESLIAGTVAALRSMQEAGRRGPQALGSERPERLPNEPFSGPDLVERLERLQARLAGQLIEARDFREADRRLREWLEDTRNPRTRYAYVLALAQCQREQGSEADASETLELALALEANSVGLNNDVAYGWIDQGIKLDEAERLIRYSLSHEPRHMAYLDTYGWLKYKKGEFAEARKWLERAAKAETRKDPVILDHLGDCLWRLGEHAAAIERWEEALKKVQDLPPDARPNADERRVRNTVQQKINEAKAGGKPPVAKVGAAEPEADSKP